VKQTRKTGIPMKKNIIISAFVVGLYVFASSLYAEEDKKVELLQRPSLLRPQSKNQKIAHLTPRDSIKAVIFTLDGNEIITYSDLMRTSLQGERRSLDDIIFETLVYLDAKKHKVDPDEDAVDRYLAKIMQENGLNLMQMEEIFRQGGRTLKEGREELRKLQAVGAMINFKIQSNLIVPRQDVEAYYATHPEIKPARYHLQYALIPFYPVMTKAEQQKDLIKKIRTEGIDFLNLSQPFWVTHGEIAQEKEFIYKLNPGKISPPYVTPDGFEFYYVVEKEEERVVPLEERYRDIVNILIQPQYTILLNEYRAKLFDNASFIYFD
jgi:parvulin-like peptidyl-prolyl isomerase